MKMITERLGTWDFVRHSAAKHNQAHSCVGPSDEGNERGSKDS